MIVPVFVITFVKLTLAPWGAFATTSPVPVTPGLDVTVNTNVFELNGPTAAAYNAVNQIRRRGYGQSMSKAKSDIINNWSHSLCWNSGTSLKWGFIFPMTPIIAFAKLLRSTLFSQAKAWSIILCKCLPYSGIISLVRSVLYCKLSINVRVI